MSNIDCGAYFMLYRLRSTLLTRREQAVPRKAECPRSWSLDPAAQRPTEVATSLAALSYLG